MIIQLISTTFGNLVSNLIFLEDCPFLKRLVVGPESVPGTSAISLLFHNEPQEVGLMGDNSTTSGPSFSDEKVECENIFTKYRHVHTALFHDSSGVSVVWRFSELGNGELSDPPPPSVSPAKTETQPTKTEILTTDQVAKELRLARKTVRNLIRKGDLMVLSGICPYKITREALNNYLRRGSRRGEPGTSAIDSPTASSSGHDSFAGRSATRLPRRSSLQLGKSQKDDVQRAIEDMDSWDDQQV